MRRLAILTVLALVVGIHSAQAATFNFESVAVGNYTSLSQTDSGLTVMYDLGGVVFQIDDHTPGGPPGFGDRTLSNFEPTCCTANPYNANFSAAQNAVSIQFGDFGPSDDDTPVTLTAFSGLNGTGAVVGTASTTWLGTDAFPNFKTLTVISAAPFLSVRFSGSGPFNNSLFWDNMLTGDQVIPEPMTLALIGSGLLGLAARRRRKV